VGRSSSVARRQRLALGSPDDDLASLETVRLDLAEQPDDARGHRPSVRLVADGGQIDHHVRRRTAGRGLPEERSDRQIARRVPVAASGQGLRGRQQLDACLDALHGDLGGTASRLADCLAASGLLVVRVAWELERRGVAREGLGIGFGQGEESGGQVAPQSSGLGVRRRVGCVLLASLREGRDHRHEGATETGRERRGGTAARDGIARSETPDELVERHVTESRGFARLLHLPDCRPDSADRRALRRKCGAEGTGRACTERPPRCRETDRVGGAPIGEGGSA